MTAERRFVVATPHRALCDDPARVLEKAGALRALFLGTRRGITGVPPERTHLLPAIGLVSYIFARTFSTTRAESLRYALHPWFDWWVSRNLRPGDHLISSYGYVNAAFRRARRQGGRTFLDGGNSHPEQYRAIMAEEYRRWGRPGPPMAPHHYRRSVTMLEDVDFVLASSTYVATSFLERGFQLEQILLNHYPLDLSYFTPALEPRPANRPFTLICTGSLSLRKGTPYLLEAFRLIRRQVPDARLLLTDLIMDDARPILAQYRDLPIEWSPPLPHAQLAERLRSADLFLLPSLEEGFVRTAAEALACGLPAILTAHTGVNDLIEPGVNGSIVPIRDAAALAEAALAWKERFAAESGPPARRIDPEALSFATFERNFLRQLRALNLLPAQAS